MNGSPFKEAWYHDFAPPIHSLDRHGDFAPPLLALTLDAGFFGLATDVDGLGNGLQYHLAQVYGPHNIGDWLDVRTTSRQTVGTGAYPLSQNFGTTGQDFVDSGEGILLRSGDGGVNFPNRNEWMLQSGQMIYYLDNVQDIGYTKGGNIVRYSGGGSILFYTTDATLANAGDFNVITSGASGNDVGDIVLDASGGDQTGRFTVYTGDTMDFNPGTVETHNLTAGGTFVVNDHLGSPLVTYTG